MHYEQTLIRRGEDMRKGVRGDELQHFVARRPPERSIGMH
jgi:hypothetical protein